MKKQLHLFPSLFFGRSVLSQKLLTAHLKKMAQLLLILFFLSWSLKPSAQMINDNGQQSTVLANGTYQDFVIPNNPQITKISFFLKGADGGAAILHMGQYIPLAGFAEIGSYAAGGGAGATVSATFLVGTGTGKIPLGSTIRFIIGEKGQTGSADINIIPDGGTGGEYGGGGGGTAILFRPPTAVANWAYNWHLLTVAGGGGGAYQGVVAGIALGLDSDGGAGREGESGGDGGGTVLSGEGGSGGEGGHLGGIDGGGGGGGANTDGTAVNGCIYPWEESNPSAGEGGLGGVTGGHGGTDEDCANLFDVSNGGFGFGGGGIGHFNSGGGGGGYSGGGAGGVLGGGGGGGSYVNTVWFSRNASSGGSTESPKDGFVRYQVTLNQPPVANCKNATIYLDANGQVSLSPSDIDNSSSDPEGEPLTFSVSESNFTCADVGPNNVTLTVTDSEGATATCTAVVTVADNSNPVVITQNITVYLDATGNATITPAQVDNGSYDNCSIDKYELDILSFDCDDLGEHTVTLTVTDVNGNSASNAATVNVIDNLPPVITSVTPDKAYLWAPDHKMDMINVTIVSVENCPGTGVSCKIVDVSSNETDDGNTEPDWEITGDNTVNLRAERFGNGTGRIYTITVECTDGSGNASQATTTVVVAHNISSPKSGATFKVGSTVNFGGNFWDIAGNKHTAKWLIDDKITVSGVVTEPSGLKNGTVTGSYKFTTPGVYKLKMNVTDQKGVTTYASTNGDLEAIVVIYDPNGGYTYGGGWYQSPAGALSTDKAAKGQVSYGYTVNYYKSATNPKGETQFKFGDFEFNAVNFDYLAISGAKGQFKGTGKITGDKSGYEFIMTVVDGALDGTRIDKVRMKIYNKTTGAIIYDNQPGANEAANPVTAIGDNSSVVISKTEVQQTATKQSKEITATAEQTVEGLELTVNPNPSRHNFTIEIKSSNKKDKLLLQVFDALGRRVELRNNIVAGSTIQVGDLYRSGAYYLKVQQGNEHKEMKLIKLSE